MERKKRRKKRRRGGRRGGGAGRRVSFGDEELMGKFKRGGGWGGWNS